ncbi:fibronectin type 3 domain-containing protein [Kineococcus xinjiangensis]|uniref:Fibronectin type 3 domain-containing protein n=1 Tax=Kineococcus xinjiangensis TaxID=512762 RepID=A0A2S6IU36_9ACTN|nr:fibronectin type III domain-containing protein [Kineococcus xinjiangensis]PPK97767.1 fibronectin type 3 domain-containing protein [Kineococcus xinjiangensis]
MTPPLPGTRRTRSLLAGTTVLSLTLVGTPGYAAAETPTWSFDFGTATSPVGSGWTAVPETNRYTATSGFGIVPVEGIAPVSRHRTSDTPDPVGDDFVLATSWGFALDVPAGSYDVRVLSGDRLAGTSTTKTHIDLEGTRAGTLQARQGVSEQTWRTTVDDGQLTVGVTGEGAGGYVNGIVVTKAAEEPQPEPEPEPEPPASALAAPTSVRMARVTDGAVTLRWNAVPDATGYVVTRSDTVGGTYTPVAETTGDVFATDAVDTTRPHYYRVRARGADGLSAPSAAAVSARTAPAPELPAGSSLSFDLGSGALAPGATRLDATSAYTAEERAGFVDVRDVTATDRKTSDPLRSDFVTVGDTELVVDLPNGDYTVSLVAGDPSGATDIALTAEQMAKVQQTAKTAGEFLEMSFDIALVDGQLNLEFAGTAANLASLVITRKAEDQAGDEPTVWVTGDSTVQTYTADYAPQAGWGQMIGRFLSDDVTVTNKAIGGRSSKNFISQGRLDEVLLNVRPGDYLFAQFGHNDNTKGVDDRYAAPADYAEYLRTFVEGARQRGATPVLVTPVSRRSFDATTGKANVSFPAYVEAAAALAAETGTPLVDLSASSRAYLDEIGAEAAKSVFLHVPAGVYPNRPNGTSDDTHFQEYGAIQMARLVARDVAELDVPLAAQVVEAEPPAAVPAAPADVVAGGVSNAGVNLTWSAVQGADIYKVFRKEAEQAEDAYALVTTSTLPQAAVSGLREGTAYDLRVVAVNGRGDSAPSAAVRVSTKAPLHKFDVQPAGSPLMPGYTEVSEKSQYTAEKGWGWISADGIGGRDRGTAFTPPPNDLERDFLLPSPAHEFVVDLPNGSYAVKTYHGDWIGTSRSNVQLEGKDFGAGNAGRGSVAQKMSQPVLVTDGRLNLVMTGSSSRLNGIEITPLLVAPTDLALADVSISGTAVEVDLTWNATDGAAGYRVLRQAAGAPAAEAIGDVAGPAFTDTTADVGLDYTYTVVALDAAGTQSVPSNPLKVTTADPDVAKAPVPTGLKLGTVGKNEVALSWNASDGALFYRVYRADPKPDGTPGPMEVVGRADGTSFTDTGVLTTVEYVYAVAAVNAGGVSDRSATVTSPAVTKLVRQAERLDRSPVAVATDGGVYVGWRMLGLDPDSIAFHVYRDGKRITDKPVTDSTNLLDAAGRSGAKYRISTVVNGIERWATGDFAVWDSQTLDVPLDKPADGVTKDGQPYSYRANDASIGDLDGDGQYEIVLKWDPTNSQDNSKSGYTGTVYLDAYELDGTRLWRIDMGRNIRAGAHYTQFQVFDLDGDGRSEVTVKTADGTVDGQGTAIGNANADHRNSSGYVLTGPEFLTVFDGRTGAAIDTVDYAPPRGDVGAWGDGYGNRVDRFLAGVAYLDGERPSVVFSRGYYTRTVVVAYDFDGSKLTKRWTFDSDVEGDEYRGQGNHQFSVADVDGDQKDEILFGAMTIDDDGTPLYSTDLYHGDAQHVSDLDPARPGLEVFGPHEDPGHNGGVIASYRDAATGEVLWSVPGSRDTGRGAAGDIDPEHAGAEAWVISDGGAWNDRNGTLRTAKGEEISDRIPAANFLTWWDGDLLREITDHDWDATTRTGVPTISKWDPDTRTSTVVHRAEGTLTNNDTKGTPTLQADLFGDWREELVTRVADSSALRIATTVDVTEHRLRTLQSDPVYRLGVSWQNTGYNQPPHTSYFLGHGMTTPAAPRIAYTGAPAEPAPRVDGPATAAPGRADLSDDNWDKDGTFLVTMNLWHGQNAQSVTFLENGRPIATQELVDATPGAQTAAVQIAGLPNGTYEYTAVLTNQHGSTTSKKVTVKVTRAAPAKPALSDDNHDGDGTYTLTTNLWWGTNATEYRLYENGELIDTQALTANGREAQQASTTVTGRPVGEHTYRAELSNAQGTTSSKEITVKVKR